MNKEINQDLIAKIEEAIQTLRPFLEADGGDIQLLRVENNVAKVKLLGACESCEMSAMTLKAGVEEAVKKAVPQITSVEAVEV
mgnify:CR=1 FL=1